MSPDGEKGNNKATTFEEYTQRLNKIMDAMALMEQQLTTKEKGLLEMEKEIKKVEKKLQRKENGLKKVEEELEHMQELLENKAKSNAILLHSLPRMDEIPPDVDITRWSRYWQEAFNGVVMRMTLLALVLGAVE